MLHLVAGLLFFLLSPGVLLTIPARSKGLFTSGQTSVLAAAVHAAVFVAILYLLNSVASIEGFALNSAQVLPMGQTTVNGKIPAASCNTANPGDPCALGFILGKNYVGSCSTDAKPNSACIAIVPGGIMSVASAKSKGIMVGTAAAPATAPAPAPVAAPAVTTNAANCQKISVPRNICAEYKPGGSKNRGFYDSWSRKTVYMPLPCSCIGV